MTRGIRRIGRELAEVHRGVTAGGRGRRVPRGAPLRAALRSAAAEPSQEHPHTLLNAFRHLFGLADL